MELVSRGDGDGEGEGCAHYGGLLEESEFYGLCRSVVAKGLADYFAVGKVLLSGVTREGRIGEICVAGVRDAMGDCGEARQLFSTLGEAFKLILRHKLYHNDGYFPISKLITPVHPHKILSKAEQSQNSLKPTLIKSLCEYLNKLVISGKFLHPSPETTPEITLIYNSLMKCTQMEVQDYRAMIRCMMAVVDSVFFEVVKEMRTLGVG